MAVAKRRESQRKDKETYENFFAPELSGVVEIKVPKIKKVEKITPDMVTAVKLSHEDVNNIKVCEEHEINDFLNIKGLTLLNLEVNSTLEKGKILTEVFDKLSGNNHYNGLYYKWLEAMNYNPRTALRQRIRYELFYCGHDDRSKKFFATLPTKLIDEIHTHKDKRLLISMVNSEELKTKEDLIKFIDSEQEETKNKISYSVPFYKQVFSYEHKIEKMNLQETQQAKLELKEIRKELLRLEKMISEKEESGNSNILV